MNIFQTRIIGFLHLTQKIAGALATIFVPLLISFSLEQNNDNIFFDWLFAQRFLIFFLDLSFTVYYVVLRFGLSFFQKNNIGINKYIGEVYVCFVPNDQFDDELELMTCKISNEAKQFFEYAEELVESYQYREAATYYKKSNSIISTLSASLNLSYCYLILGEYENAEDLLVDSINQFKDLNIPDLYAFLLLNQSVVYIKTYRYKLAIEASLNAKKAFLKIDDELGESFAIGNKAIALFHSGLYEKALRLQKKNLRLHKKIKMNELVASDYNNIANIYRSQGIYNKAEKLYKKALAYMENCEQNWHEAEILVSLGVLYCEMNKQQLAKESLIKALNIWQTISNPNGICTTLCVLARNEKKRINSLNYIHEARDYAETASDDSLRSLVLRTEGELYLQDKRNDKALNAFSEALELIKDTNNECVKASLNRKIGEIFLMKKDGEKALEYFKKALDSDALLNDNLSKTEDLLFLGDTYKFLGNKKEAYKVYKKAKATSIHAKAVHFEITSLFMLAKLELTMSVKGEWLTAENSDRSAAQKAIQYYNRIIKISKEDEPRSKILAYNLKAEVLRLLGNEKFAFRMHKNAKIISEQAKDNRGVAESLLGMSSLMTEKNKELAIDYNKEALKIATKANDKFLIKNSLMNLISRLKNIGDKESAKKYEEKLKTLLESLTNEDKEKFKLRSVFPG